MKDKMTNKLRIWSSEMHSEKSRALVMQLRVMCCLSICMLPLSANAQFTFSQTAAQFHESRFVGSDDPQTNSYLWPYTLAATDPNRGASQLALASSVQTMIDAQLTAAAGSLTWSNTGGGQQKASIDVNTNLQFRACVVLGDCPYSAAAIPPVAKLQPVNMRIEVVRNIGADTVITDAYPVGLPVDDIDRSIHADIVWKSRKLNLPAMKLLDQSVSYCDKSSIQVRNPVTNKKGTVNTCDSGSGYYSYNAATAEKAVLVGEDQRFELATTRSPDELRLHVFNVNSGNCGLLECPVYNDAGGSVVNKAIILDCGIQKNNKRKIANSAGEYYFQRNFFDILQSKDQVDMVTSHSDVDHYYILADWYKKSAEFRNILDTKLRNTYMGGTRKGYKVEEFGNTIKKLYAARKNTLGSVEGDLYLMQASGAVPQVIPLTNAAGRTSGTGAAPTLGVSASTKALDNTSVNTISVACGGANVRFLAANSVPGELKRDREDAPKAINSQSIVTYIEYGGKDLLMAADAGSVSLEAAVTNAIAAGIDIQNLDVLSVPHHGSEADYHYDNHVEGSDGFNDKDLISGAHNFQAWARPKKLLYQAGGDHSMPFDRSAYSFLNAFPLDENNSTLDSIDTNIPGQPAFNHYFAPGKFEYSAGGVVGSPIPSGTNSRQKVKVASEFKKEVFVTSDNGDMVFSIKNGGALTANCLGPFLKGGANSSKVEKRERFASREEAYLSSRWCLPQ